MVLAEKKLQFTSVTNDEELPTKEPEPVSDPELCNVAKKAVEEVIAKATVTVAERLESNAPELNFVDLPRIQIDSAPSSPEPKDKFDEKNGLIGVKVEEKLMTFGDAPEEVKDTAMAFVKEILRRAAAMLEEKSMPTVPFNFEDVDLMKNSGPWYVRVREALIRLLRTACFCTPRRTDS